MAAIRECTELEGTWNNAVQSIDVDGACVKFYDGSNCDGKHIRLTQRKDYGAANLQLIGLGKKISSFAKC